MPSAPQKASFAASSVSQKRKNQESVPLNLLEGKERDIELKIADQEARTLVANQKKAKRERVRTEGYRCPHCSYAATQMGSLTTHVRIHTGEQPFECPQCPFKARYRYNLKKHMQTEHPKPGAQPGAQSGGYQFMHSIYFNHCF